MNIKLGGPPAPKKKRVNVTACKCTRVVKEVSNTQSIFYLSHCTVRQWVDIYAEGAIPCTLRHAFHLMSQTFMHSIRWCMCPLFTEVHADAQLGQYLVPCASLCSHVFFPSSLFFKSQELSKVDKRSWLSLAIS